MNPETRTLLKVKVEDAVEADEIFSVLMGDEVGAETTVHRRERPLCFETSISSPSIMDWVFWCRHPLKVGLVLWEQHPGRSTDTRSVLNDHFNRM